MARGGPPKKDEDGRSLWAAVTSTVRPLGDRPMRARGLDRRDGDDGRDRDRPDRDRPDRDRRDDPPHPLSDKDAAKAAMRRRIARVAAHNAEAAKAALTPEAPALAPGKTPGLDRRSAERLRRGKLRIDGRLDLHGMSREAAHVAVVDFVLTAHATGKRCVILVTGKGRGILKENAPHWLNLPPLRDKIVAIETCRPEHGGDGALYVLLKRRRTGAVTPFGRRLREMREARGVTLSAMAEALGVSAAYLSALEHGRRPKPTPARLDQICAYFGVIWDEAEALKDLARLSNPRVVIDTAGLSPEATELANRLAQRLRHLSREELRDFLKRLEG